MTTWVRSILDWCAGGDPGYCTLMSCMKHDMFWIGLTVFLDFAVTIGYGVIAWHWWKNERNLPMSPARRALATMRNIFAFCGVCGYLFIPVKLYWPAWRLYDLFMVVLVFYTWRYVFSAQGLKVVYTSLGRSNKLAADLAESREESNRKSVFLNAISHDLRTPLNGLLLHASLAELHVSRNDPAATIKSLDEIKTQARLTAELLDGLLDFARVDSGQDRPHPAAVDLDHLIAEVLNTHALAASNKSLQYPVPEPTGIVMQTDRLKLERILNNLVGNAIKFTSAGEVAVRARKAGTSVEITVTDTGIGIPAEHLPRLFDEFYQVENRERDRAKGFGLGLAISRKLCGQLGGTVTVQSEAGRGSTFKLSLPVTLQRPVLADGNVRSELTGVAAVSMG
jgi:signal transduction histidine kinase